MKFIIKEIIMCILTLVLNNFDICVADITAMSGAMSHVKKVKAGNSISRLLGSITPIRVYAISILHILQSA